MKRTTLLASAFILNALPVCHSAYAVEDSATVIEEVTVTARKREESLQDVPIAITALSDEMLEQGGLEDITDMYGAVPSLYFSQGNFAPTTDFTYLVMRGVGAAPALDPSVGVFIDGVYQTSVGFDLDFLEVERVEVMRGPQSVLFGRNTLGGAVNFVTSKPTEELTGKFSAEVSGYDDIGDGYKVKGHINGGLADNVFGGLSLLYKHDDGYIRNTTLGSDQLDSDVFSVRGSLAWEPTDTIEVLFTADYTHNDSNELGYGVGQGIDQEFTVSDNLQSNTDREIFGASLTINAEFSSFDLTLITGYRNTDAEVIWDADSTDSTQLFFNAGFPSILRPDEGFDGRNTEQAHLGQEIRLTSNAPESKLTWMLGAYIFDEDNDLDRQGEFPTGGFGAPPVLFAGSVPGAEGVFIKQNKSGWSIFGQVSYQILEPLELSFGARYTEETADYQADVGFLVPISETFDFPFAVNIDESTKFTDFLPMASISYQLNDNISIYGTWSTGFKSGGFQKFPANAIADAEPFENEQSENFEIGIKGHLSNLTFAAAVYHTKLTDQQVNVTVLVDTGGGMTTPVGGVRNAGEGEVTGVEIEAAFRPTDKLNISGNIAYNDTKFTDYVDAQGTQRNGDVHEDFPYVPELTYSIQAEYDTEIINGYVLSSLLRFKYFDEYYTGDGGFFSPFEDIAGYGVVDLRIALEIQKWTTTLFVNNLLDEEANTQRFTSFTNAVNKFDTPIPPRQIGLKFSYNF